jgi:hypothetical protein
VTLFSESGLESAVLSLSHIQTDSVFTPFASVDGELFILKVKPIALIVARPFNKKRNKRPEMKKKEERKITFWPTTLNRNSDAKPCAKEDN